jgi:hypothetical protein
MAPLLSVGFAHHRYGDNNPKDQELITKPLLDVKTNSVGAV